MPWSAVALVGRTELRRRWRSLVVLGLIAGVVGAVVLGSLHLTLRTASAPQRMVDATQLDDARVVLYGGQVAPEQITSLPGVTDHRVTRMGVGQVSGVEIGFASVSAGTPSDTVFTPVLIDGRAADPRAVDEVVVLEEYSDAFDLRVGEVAELTMLTPEEINSFDTGFGLPDGPRVQLRVTGVARLVRDVAGDQMTPFLATPAFARQHRSVMPVTTVMLRMADPSPAGKRRLQAAADELAAGLAPVEGGEEFPTVAVEFPQKENAPAVRSARTILVAGLAVLVGVSLLTGLLAVAQALTRHYAGGAAAQRVEAALGLTRGERALARAVPAVLSGVVAGLLGAGGALAAARLEPLGALRAYEPDPGWLPDWRVVVGGGAAVAVVVVLLAALTAARTLRSAAADVPAPGAVPVTRAARGAPALVGTSFALGRGRAGVPVRATLVAASLGVAGVVAAATFGASLDRLADTPSRYGWNADFAWIDAKDPVLADIDRRDDVVGVTLQQDTSVRVGDRAVAAFAADVRSGDAPWTVLAGELPDDDGEVAVGQRLAQQLGVDVGDELVLQAGAGPLPVRVVGRLVVPTLSGERFGEVLMLHGGDLAAAGVTQPFTTALITTTGPERAQAVYDELAAELELAPRSRPADVANLVSLGDLPVALGVFLAVLAGAALVHALVVTVRRRAADLAVLRVIGFTPRQVGRALVTMAGLTSLVGLVVGIPLGLGLGRVVWREVADEIGVAGDPAVPWLVLAVLPAAVLGTALMVSLLPARRAARISPAAVLRAE